MQCPNCTFYKVDRELSSYRPEIGRKSDPNLAGAFFVVVVSFIIWLVGSAVMITIAKSHGLGGDSIDIFGAIWTIGCFLVCCYRVAGQPSRTSPVLGPEIRYSFYTCRHCGYTW